jgi:hypothetical protein
MMPLYTKKASNRKYQEYNTVVRKLLANGIPLVISAIGAFGKLNNRFLVNLITGENYGFFRYMRNEIQEISNNNQAGKLVSNQ